MRGFKSGGMTVAGVALAASLAGCAGMPSAADMTVAPKMADALAMGSTSRVTVIARDELAQSLSLEDALRLHPAVDITGR